MGIRSERGEMQDTHFVSETDDVKIFRFRRQTVSLFDMSGRIGDLEAENNGLPDKLAKIQTVADDAKAQAAANAAQFKEDIKAAADKAAADIKAQGTKFDTQVSTSTNSAGQARSSMKDALQASISAGVASAKSEATAAISAQAASDSSKFSALERALADATAAAAGASAVAAANKKILDGTSEPMIVGWHQCEYSGSNGANSNGFVGMTCAYNKKRDDTIMMFSVNSNQRQINGWSKWKIQVSSANSGGWKGCRGPKIKATATSTLGTTVPEASIFTGQCMLAVFATGLTTTNQLRRARCRLGGIRKWYMVTRTGAGRPLRG